MKGYIKFLTISILISYSGVMSAQQGMQYQNKYYPDSSFYWINSDYIECVKSENSICNCLSQNEIVMMFIDIEKSEATVQSSIFHFGLEQYDLYDLIGNDGDSSYFAINSWRSDSITILFENENLALISYKGREIYFKKEYLKTLHIPKTSKGIFSQVLDMSEQLGAINSTSILSYRPASKSDTIDIIIPYDSLQRLIEEKKVFIYCSQDFYYNEMIIKSEPFRYFYLEYEENKLILYDEVVGRDLEEQVNLDRLKRQTFIRK